MEKKYTHSHFVRLNFNGTPAAISVYPNPVVEELSVNLDALTDGSVLVELLNEQGNTILRQYKMIQKGKNTINFDLQGKGAGKFLLRVANKQAIHIKQTV